MLGAQAAITPSYRLAGAMGRRFPHSSARVAAGPDPGGKRCQSGIVRTPIVMGGDVLPRVLPLVFITALRDDRMVESHHHNNMRIIA